MASRNVELRPISWETADDLARISVESLFSSTQPDARALASTGTLRLAGEGVTGHQVDIDRLGAFAAAWQRAVTAVGASLEGFRSARGRLSNELVSRTKLLLVAPPSGGSIVLEVAPKVHGLDDGTGVAQRPMFDAPQALADRSVTALLDLLTQLAGEDLVDLDSTAAKLRELGPRVAGSVRVLADSLAEGHLDIHATWREPGEATKRTSVSSAQAVWIRRFIDGRDLEAEDATLRATAVTVSNRERWLVEVEGEVERVNASGLELDEVRKVRPGDEIALRVRTTVTLQPDGSHRARHEAIEVLAVHPPD